MNHPDKTSTSSFLSKLLTVPSYRVVRHLLLITILVIVSFNQSFMTMEKGLEQLGYKIIYQAAFIFVAYLTACYFNLYVLLPRYLLRKQYVRYTACLAAFILLIVTMQTLEERAVQSSLHILNSFYKPPMIFINMLSSSVLVLLCISGGAMTILLKHWMTDNHRVLQLEKLHIQSEVEQLKEQVSPHLLFNILNRTGVLVKFQPAEASEMLIKLSQLLRYQLYDCNRAEVLLGSEIKFLNNYLTLEQMYSHLFQFQIKSDKDCFHILISPLLLISFVQTTVIKIYERNKETCINLSFESTENDMLFTCGCMLEGIFSDADFSKVSKRLDLLYSQRYSLAVTDNEIRLKLNI